MPANNNSTEMTSMVVSGRENPDRGVRKQSAAFLKFEYILDRVGKDGRHQKMLLFLFLLPLAFYIPFGSSSLILMLSTPQHMCRVPARDSLKMSRSIWRRITIPWVSKGKNSGHYSQCLMKNVTFYEGENDSIHFNIDPKTNTTCQYGWEYDTRWWDQTAVTEHNWVCDESYVAPVVLTLAILSNVVGTFTMNLLATRIGRRPVFFSCVLICAVFGIINLFCSTALTFAFTKCLSSFAFFSMYQVSYILVIEQSCGELRGYVAPLCAIAMTLGLASLSLAGWLARSWRVLGLICYLPCFLFLLTWKLVPESPRWLLSRGRLEECSTVLHLIATRNKRCDPPLLMKVLFEVRKQERREGTLSLLLFLKEPVTRKRILIVVAKSCILCVMSSGMSSTVPNLTQNWFVNFFALSLVEIPGFLLGMVSAKFLGRRLTTIYAQIVAGGLCFMSSAVTQYSVALTVLSSLGRLFLAGASVTAFMQVGELFPTVLRPLAYGTAGSVGLLATLSVRSILALGTLFPPVPLILMGTMGVVGAGLSSLLPETLGRPLPQTFTDAISIGQEQSFFTFIHHWNVHWYTQDESTVCDGDTTGSRRVINRRGEEEEVEDV